MSKFSKDADSWLSPDPTTDHVVKVLDDGTMITRDGYILDAPPPPPPITRPQRIVYEEGS